MIMVSFCWKMNVLPNKINNKFRFINDVLEINYQSCCILSWTTLYSQFRNYLLNKKKKTNSNMCVGILCFWNFASTCNDINISRTSVCIAQWESKSQKLKSIYGYFHYRRKVPTITVSLLTRGAPSYPSL